LAGEINRSRAMPTVARQLADVLECAVAMLLVRGPVEPPPTYAVREPGALFERIVRPPRLLAPRRQAGRWANRWADKPATRRPGRRVLQVCVLAAASVAVGGGAWGVVTALNGPASGLVSHERYLSGLLLAIGLAFWTTLPAIEHKAARFALLTSLVMAGGLCRLLGIAAGDPMSATTAAALAMELVVAPTLFLWLRAYSS
jgi:hypothetical protein